MWVDVEAHPRAMQAYLYLRRCCGDSLMCKPGDEATTLEMCQTGKIAVSIEPNFPAFAMVMRKRGGEIAVCGPGHGDACLREAERLALECGIEVVNAWVRDENKPAKKLFKRGGYTVIGRSLRNGISGVRYARALR